MDMNSLPHTVTSSLAVVATSGSSVKVVVITDGVETVIMDHSVPVGKTFSGLATLRGELA